jgi:hypothetical protein
MCLCCLFLISPVRVYFFRTLLTATAWLHIIIVARRNILHSHKGFHRIHHNETVCDSAAAAIASNRLLSFSSRFMLVSASIRLRFSRSIKTSFLCSSLILVPSSFIASFSTSDSARLGVPLSREPPDPPELVGVVTAAFAPTARTLE